MSDDLETTTEDVVETPANEQEVADATPDTEDVGALRRALEREREERRQAKDELRRIREDETTRAELLKEWGYEVADEEDSDEELFDEDDPVAPLTSKLSELEAWKQQQEAKESAAAIRRDLDSFHEGSEWDLDDDDRQAIVERASRQNPKGFGPNELKQAHDWFIKRLDRAAEAAVERAKQPKPKAPHVTAAGKAATGTKSTLDMTPEELREFARERYLQMEQG